MYKRYPPCVRNCQVPGCGEDATRGEDWQEPQLRPVEAYRQGIELGLTVRDIAVVLRLCDTHADELARTAWEASERLLAAWQWRPLPPSSASR